MEEVRFIPLSTQNAFQNMAIDEALMISIKEESSPPVLRFYRWKPSAVSIGTFQGMNDEVDVEFCGKNDIDCIRRITGGGAVFHDYEGEITYSIILPRGHRLAPDDIVESYKVLCSGIIEAMCNLDIEAEFKPVNDIVSGGKKISGNAQTRRHSCILQHGTILLDLDVRRMFTVLKVPEEKISDKMISDAKDRVTSIRDILQRKVSVQELYQALSLGFSEALNLDLQTDQLTDQEIERAAKLREEKYSTSEWNFSR